MYFHKVVNFISCIHDFKTYNLTNKSSDVTWMLLVNNREQMCILNVVCNYLQSQFQTTMLKENMFYWNSVLPHNQSSIIISNCLSPVRIRFWFWRFIVLMYIFTAKILGISGMWGIFCESSTQERLDDLEIKALYTGSTFYLTMTVASCECFALCSLFPVSVLQILSPSPL